LVRARVMTRGVPVMTEYRSKPGIDVVAAQERAETSIWVSIAQAAARVGVSPRTIKRWIAAGYLPAVRSPSPKGKGHLRVRVGEVDAALVGGTVR
jgi:excisionase family DNA binding protein